jgi:hypothetical protein
MQKSRYIIFIILCLASIKQEAQSFVFGFKGGPVIATQNWSNFQRDPLFDLHGIAFIETWAEDSPNILFAQIGYHARGSSLRQIFVNPATGFIPQTRSFRFRNLALTVGAKKKLSMGTWSPFYTVGLRGEYTVSTNLDEFVDQNFTSRTAYPLNEFVRKFNYGIYVGGGTEFAINDLIGVVMELSVNPDLSRQYFQPPLTNVYNPNPFNGQSTINLSEREIRNVTLELTFGFRFLRQVVYYD